MNTLLTIFFIFLVLGSLSILFFKKRNKKELEHSNRNTLIEAPSKEEIDMLLATCISYDFEPTEDFKDIPYRQVLYLEKTYNQDINSYIQANLGSIQKEYAKRSCDFIYLPYWLSNNNVQELVKYNAAQSLDSTINPSNITPHFTEKFFEWIKCQAPDIPIVISISRRPVDGHIRRFVAFPVNDADMKSFFSVHAYISIYPKGPLYRLIPGPTEDASLEADEFFSSEAKRLILEIQERVNRLRAIGFYSAAIKALRSQSPISPSRLLITKDFRLFLTDYENTEIIMTPLPKAVFLLFLKHPEGILFKELPQYKEELLNIYKQITNRDNIQDILSSIENVTNPHRNSINEKCSRIREAFVEHFDESLMASYFITGERGTAKKIALNRTYVVWE